MQWFGRCKRGLSVEGKTKFDADVQFYKKYMILPDMKSLMLHLVVTAL